MQPVHHDPGRSRFVIQLNDQESVLEYGRRGDQMQIMSTYVPPAHRNQGIAAALTRAALEFADQQSLSVIPHCSYAQKFIEEHSEFQRLLPQSRR